MIQKQINLSDKRVLIVEVPEGSEAIKIFKGKLQYDYNGSVYYTDLPTGSWLLMGVTPLTEEQAAKVVEKDYRGYKHYWLDKGHVPRGFNHRYSTALESFHSLLTAHDLDVNGRYAVMVGEPTTKK